ncbi:MAG: PIG-L family deacetylase [Bryobacterales bacterium]|nr:PIG-L family deacetylase [Bryobacterales bacterium]
MTNPPRVAFLPLILLMALAVAPSTAEPIQVIAIGAHPDDCDIKAGGIAAKYAAAGHNVKFVSVTNGDAGHQSEGGGMLAARRRAEAQESGRRLGIEYEVLDNHDGELVPSLEVRMQIIRRIREWDADIVIAPRPNDYHPDHRYTGILVQDASYMVTVPNLASDTPPTNKTPLFLYFSDRFTRPQPFRPDIVVSIDDVVEKKYAALDAHVSQFYEWLPWHAGRLDEVPKDPKGRLAWLKAARSLEISDAWREAARARYGAAADSIERAEAFEITEYGLQPTEAQIRRLMPFFPD